MVFKLNATRSYWCCSVINILFVAIAGHATAQPVIPAAVDLSAAVEELSPAIEDVSLDITTHPAGLPADRHELQLEVWVNDISTTLIAQCYQEMNGKLLMEPDELRAVGIKPQKAALRKDGLIDIDRLSDVTFRYDADGQALYFTAPDHAREAFTINARAVAGSDPDSNSEESAASASSLGAVVNYTIYTATGNTGQNKTWDFEGISGAFDARLFSNYGVLSTSQAVQYPGSGQFSATRLDTVWSYADPVKMLNYRMGDIISGGLSWTRPVRLGGVQIQRNFSLRPDLITMPLPQMSGTAAVPATVDVYINNTKTLSQDITAGPFSVTNLPIVTGNGTARLVVRDILGREVVSETGFYASSNLLATGLMDFSLDAGFSRRFYGLQSFDYDDRLMAAATMRYGVRDNLTLEAHAETGGGLYNAGLAPIFNLGNYGIGALSAAVSNYQGKTGTQISASFETEVWGMHLYARSQRSFDDYHDIASITAERSDRGLQPNLISSQPPRALDQISLSMPLRFDPAILNFSFTHLQTIQQDRSAILSVGLTRQIGKNINLYASAFKDLKNNHRFGLFAGLSVALDNNLYASTSVSSDGFGTSLTTDLVRTEPYETGGYGWRLRDIEGKTQNRAVAASYRAPFARLEGSISQSGDHYRANAQVEGAVVLVGGELMLHKRINDAFVIVNTGAPDVAVALENQPVGQTNRRGKLLVSDLRAYEKNRISIDPSNLPLGAILQTTREMVVPQALSGSVVDFNVRTDITTVELTLLNETGEPVEVGSTGRLQGQQQDFIIGYDGLAYVSDIQDNNIIIIEQPNHDPCEVRFSHNNKDESAIASPLICHPAHEIGQ